MNKRWISHEEIAEALGVSRQTVHARLKDGMIPGQTKKFGKVRVERKVALAWIESGASETKYEAPPNNDTSRVYFIQQMHGDHPVKIGYTGPQRINSRLKDLSCASPYPLKLLGSFPGGREDERKLHRRFKACKLRGEWFQPDEKMRKYMESGVFKDLSKV